MSLKRQTFCSSVERVGAGTCGGLSPRDGPHVTNFWTPPDCGDALARITGTACYIREIGCRAIIDLHYSGRLRPAVTI
ncbi:hypothetical protein RRG08_039699 [Elysia crispata]|uniref:Uncharacterized protein n=1 Tax=Elysia crispata TaxID=231223 RepID=A0AAE1CVR6_9GAST|nr:hypothetical protein RRG08_039699 [Elysia crispata]